MTINLGNGSIIGIGVIEIVIVAVQLVLFIGCIVAYFMSIKCLVDAAWAKTEKLSRGQLWFIGLFATPVVLGLIVMALKDEKGVPATPQPVREATGAAAPDPQPAAALTAGEQAPAE